jgi:hypothetical protein
MKYFARIFCLGAALIAAPLAYATPISGSIGFGGNGTYNSTTDQFTAGAIIPSTTGNGYVNVAGTGTLTMFTTFNPATFYSFNAATIGPGEAVFTTTEGATTLSFLLTSFTADGSNPAGGGFTGSGILSETGYSATAATFSLNTNASAGTFITFNTATVTPEPSSLVLLGSGLVGAAGMLIRRRRIA